MLRDEIYVIYSSLELLETHRQEDIKRIEAMKREIDCLENPIIYDPSSVGNRHNESVS
jgi:hypothetical protein